MRSCTSSPAERSATILGGHGFLGVVAGALAKAADESGIPWAGDLGCYPAAWVLAVALIGRAAPTWRAAAVRAALFFAAMTVAYYAYAAWVLGFGWNRLLPVWLILSATAVACAAVAVVLALLLSRDGSTRAWALVLAASMAWLAGRGLDVLAAAVA